MLVMTFNLSNSFAKINREQLQNHTFMLCFKIQNMGNTPKNTFKINKVIFLLIVLFSSLSVTAQNPKIKLDSIVEQLGIKDKVDHVLLENKAEMEKKARLEKYINHQKVQHQNKIFNLIELEVQNAKFLLTKGFDYKDITEEIYQLKRWEEFAVKGIVGKKFRVLTDRNLSSTSILLDEILSRTDNHLKKITLENQELGKAQEK